MAAMATSPWSSSKVVPSSSVTVTGLCGHGWTRWGSTSRGSSSLPLWLTAGESEAGKLSSTASSVGPIALAT